MRIQYYGYWVRYADAWLTETQSSAKGLADYLSVSPSRVHVVPNSCSDYYLRLPESQVQHVMKLPNRENCVVRLLYLTNYKPHKNLEIIPDVINELKMQDKEKRYIFVTTLDEQDARVRRLLRKANKQQTGSSIMNIGYVPVWEGPSLYVECDALFQPTLLEVFSASYPEAMCMGIPIITSDRNFARDVCGSSACYFDPLDPADAARAIMKVCSDSVYRDELITNGKKQLKTFGTSRERFESLIEILTIIEKKCSN
jgi:glycosyltransferase involved in cell wall biosynthesis